MLFNMDDRSQGLLGNTFKKVSQHIPPPPPPPPSHTNQKQPNKILL